MEGFTQSENGMLSAIADELADVRQQIDTLDERRKTLEEQLITGMLSQGVQSFKTSHGRQPYLVERTFFTIPPESKSQIPEWLDSRGDGDIVQEKYVNPRTLESYLRKVMEAGEALPLGITKATKPGLGFRGI